MIVQFMRRVALAEIKLFKDAMWSKSAIGDLHTSQNKSVACLMFGMDRVNRIHTN